MSCNLQVESYSLSVISYSLHVMSSKFKRHVKQLNLYFLQVSNNTEIELCKPHSVKNM